jgi:hypothetical protein
LTFVSDHLNKVFTNESKKSGSRKVSRTKTQMSEDITLLEANESRRATISKKPPTASVEHAGSSNSRRIEPANVGRKRSITAEEDGEVQHYGKQSMAEKMIVTYKEDGLHSTPTPVKQSGPLLPVNDGSLHSTETHPRMESMKELRPITRALGGQTNGDRQLRLPKLRSPSPIRWTSQNHRWKEKYNWTASLVFPAEGRKRATVDAADIERLDEGEFLNDNIIAFYLRYLEDQLEKTHPELSKRIYFQNTYFYDTLTKGKVRSNNINYDAVKRWTAKEDLFSYDYIIVPVNEKLHWYVAIICNTPKLLGDETANEQISHDCAKSPPRILLDHQPTVPHDDSANDSEILQVPDTVEEAADSSLPGKYPKSNSASPSVIAQVEHLSLDDGENEWPAPDEQPHVQKAAFTGPDSAGKAFNLTADSDLNTSVEPKAQLHGRLKAKKLKRKSIPPRKYNPTDPRIITLDSLGISHSPTCSNLREYLVCEAKERRNFDITANRLGMTAKGLPQQSNYCDCGIFVLGYIENFLKDPDAFVHNILQGEVAASGDWTGMNASKMRETIRNLIFDLGAEQTQRNIEKREAKGKARKAPKAQLEATTSDVPSSAPGLASGNSSKPTTPRAQSPNTDNPNSDATSGSDFVPVDVDGSNLEQHRRSGKKRASPTVADNPSGSDREGKNPTAEPRVAKQAVHTKFVDDSPPITPSFQDGEIMETPAPPKSPIILLDSPLDEEKELLLSSKSSRRITAEKPNRRTSVMKQFAKPSTSPSLKTHHNTRQHGSNAHEALDIDVSDDELAHVPEVRETPDRQMRQEDSFEDIMAAKLASFPSPPSRPRREDSVSLLSSSTYSTPRLTPKGTRSSPRKRRQSTPYPRGEE